MIPCDGDPMAGLKLSSFKRRWLNGYKWSEDGLPAVESIPNKRYCPQKAPQLARYFAAVSGRISSQTHLMAVLQRLSFIPGVQACVSCLLYSTGKTGYGGADNIKQSHPKNGGVFFSVMSRIHQTNLFSSSFPLERKWSLFYPSFETKNQQLRKKEILVHDGIMLCSRTPVYVFYASTANSQRYRDEILQIYVQFFWMLWAQTAF
ncbi:hypothetical protein TNCV_602971 [Trichonephila clavipes]|nr:hypothetical protein TNCV_602971 [Trichonephila clavipes]